MALVEHDGVPGVVFRERSRGSRRGGGGGGSGCRRRHLLLLLLLLPRCGAPAALQVVAIVQEHPIRRQEDAGTPRGAHGGERGGPLGRSVGAKLPRLDADDRELGGPGPQQRLWRDDERPADEAAVDGSPQKRGDLPRFPQAHLVGQDAPAKEAATGRRKGRVARRRSAPLLLPPPRGGGDGGDAGRQR